MNARFLLACWLLLWCAIPRSGSAAPPPIRVYAAVSLTQALEEIAQAYEDQTHTPVRLALGGTPSLAGQIDNGAPADVFIAADRKWMDYLAAKGYLKDVSRLIAGNTLVLIAPRTQPFTVQPTKNVSLDQAFEGKLCTANVDTVPAGIYAKQALISLGWWTSIAARIVNSADVRAALTFVERGECSAGIVYATDAKISDRVTVVMTFPSNTHTPIAYSAAVLKGAGPGGPAFFEYLSRPGAQAIFRRYGFLPPP